MLRLLLITLFLSINNVYANEDYLPQQIHISYTDEPTEMMITWVTLSNPDIATVKYSLTLDYPILTSNTSSNNITKFVDGGSLHRVIYINRVLLTDLTIGGKYFYVCGSKQYGWSSVYKFIAMRNFTEFGEYLRIIFYGDLGDTNSISLSSIQDMVETNDIDAVLHIGDFAYDFHDNNGLVGDQFMMDIEPIAAYTPYMTAVGNHEAEYNYSHYRNRFTMPNFLSENMLYSWNIGPVHIISFSSEVYFQPDTHLINKDYDAVIYQFEWLTHDLTIANLPENRKKQPWIITMAHRPMYCSTPNDDACTWMKNPIRDGILAYGKLRYGLEQLFYDFEVDLEMWGHEHTYERTYPVYRKIPYTKNISVANGTSYYYNPIVPVHIIAGSPGDKEMNGKPLDFTNNSWSVVRTANYSFSYMEIYNSTHLHIQQINGETTKLIDDLWIIK